MKRQILLWALCAFAFGMGSLCAQEQAQEGLFVSGKMKVEKGRLDGKVELHKDGQRIRTRSLSGSGKFDFVLEFNHDYIFTFSQEGQVTKKIRINTAVPPTRLTELFDDFQFHVTLFEQYEGLNTVVFNQPVGYIKYDENFGEYGDFDYDTDYSKSVQQAIADVELELEKKREEQAQQERPPQVKQKEEKPPPPPKEVVKREPPPPSEKKVERDPPPPKPKPKKKSSYTYAPQRKTGNTVVLHSYTVGEMGYPNLSAYGFINFGDGAGRREISKEEFDKYAKIYH